MARVGSPGGGAWSFAKLALKQGDAVSAQDRASLAWQRLPNEQTFTPVINQTGVRLHQLIESTKLRTSISF